jgi:PTS system nitrogen regulatory IIA component
MQISEFLRPENVIVGLAGANKRAVLEALCGRIAALSGGDAAVIFAALDNREKLGSTGMGRGIAIPHATVEGIGRPVGMLARLNRPVEFDAIDEAPVDIVFVLLVPEHDRAAGLKLLSAAARILRSDEVVARMRAAGDAAPLYAAVATSDA